MSDESGFEPYLTQSEAETLYELVQKLNREMNDRLSHGDSMTSDEVSFTTLVRGKQLRYLREVYGVDDSEETDE